MVIQKLFPSIMAMLRGVQDRLLADVFLIGKESLNMHAAADIWRARSSRAAWHYSTKSLILPGDFNAFVQSIK